MKTKLTCALAAALSTSPVWAETKALDPHVHGIATLQLVQEGGELAITLDSPAASLIGFEHAPETDAQMAAVEQLRVQLESFSGALLINAAAGCAVTESDVAMLAEMDHDDDHHDHKHGDEHHGDEHHDEHKHGEEHHEDEHHDEHKHDEEHHEDEHHDEHKHGEDEHHEEHKHGEDEHDHDHGDHDGESSVHSEINALWLLTCSAPDKLETLDVLLFDGNAYLETVNAEMLLEAGPRVQALTPSQTVLNLK